jgi:glutamine synthetase
MHLNFSLWSRDGHNRFHSPGAPDSLSGEARGFLAGVIEHLPGLIGLTAPSFNSFPQPWAGATAGWGHGGRSLPLRVPAGGSGEASTHAEFTAADASCNPYLAIGGLIAAGVDGLVRGLLLPEAVEDDLAGRPFEDEPAAEAGTEDTAEPAVDSEIGRLPGNQAEALDALEADEVLMEAMGSSLARSYLAVRRSEWELFSAKNSAFVERGYFNRY